MLPFLWLFSSVFFVPKTVSGIMMGQIVILYNTLSIDVILLQFLYYIVSIQLNQYSILSYFSLILYFEQ